MIRRAKRKAKKCKKNLCMKYCETKAMQDALLWNFFMDFFYFASLEISMSIALNFNIITVNDNVNDMAGIILCYFFLEILSVSWWSHWYAICVEHTLSWTRQHQINTDSLWSLLI